MEQKQPNVLVIQNLAFPVAPRSDADSEQFRYEENVSINGPRTLDMISKLPSVPDQLLRDWPDLVPGRPLMMFALPYVAEHFGLPDRNELLKEWMDNYGIVDLMKMMREK